MNIMAPLCVASAAIAEFYRVECKAALHIPFCGNKGHKVVTVLAILKHIKCPDFARAGIAFLQCSDNIWASRPSAALTLTAALNAVFEDITGVGAGGQQSGGERVGDALGHGLCFSQSLPFNSALQ